MLFTRTLRRKLMLGVALVLGMLLILAISGITGLNSYRTVIRDLDYDINSAPQQAELVHSVGALFEPLRIRVRADHPEDVARQQAELGVRLEELAETIDEYRRRTEALPPSSGPLGRRPVTDALLAGIAGGLSRIESDLLPLLAKESTRSSAVARIKDQVIVMLTAARQVPDPVEGLKHNLDQAKRVYRSSLTAVWITSGVVIALFIGLLRSGYVWIFHPIRVLHQGALRVAHGDFDYRVQLKTRDEMAELADAFNQMTGRFQEITADLDRQVQERSRQLVRSERLAGVGFLAAGVAHEINNPLSAIAMAAESLEGRVAEVLTQMESAEADVVQQYLQMIQSESFRCREITERLLDFARGREAIRERTDLSRLVTEVVAMVQHLSKYRDKTIEFDRHEPCYAEVNRSEIKQVVLNLVANGLEAMPAEGTLSIAIVEQTDQVRIEFHDDGCGMTTEVMDNMFEPFFTRKQAGQGTGLGLSISHPIVVQHGGTIAASSPGPGQGSTFVVRLPRRAADQSAAA
ncbi:MAG: sensor histidine kinase [Planctomycetales bacterium]